MRVLFVAALCGFAYATDCPLDDQSGAGGVVWPVTAHDTGAVVVANSLCEDWETSDGDFSRDCGADGSGDNADGWGAITGGGCTQNTGCTCSTSGTGYEAGVAELAATGNACLEQDGDYCAAGVDGTWSEWGACDDAGDPKTDGGLATEWSACTENDTVTPGTQGKACDNPTPADGSGTQTRTCEGQVGAGAACTADGSTDTQNCVTTGAACATGDGVDSVACQATCPANGDWDQTANGATASVACGEGFDPATPNHVKTCNNGNFEDTTTCVAIEQDECTCENGTGTTGDDCATDTEADCDSCDDGFKIDASTATDGHGDSCVATACTCTGGTEAKDAACTEAKEGEYCTACQAYAAATVAGEDGATETADAKAGYTLKVVDAVVDNADTTDVDETVAWSSTCEPYKCTCWNPTTVNADDEVDDPDDGLNADGKTVAITSGTVDGGDVVWANGWADGNQTAAEGIWCTTDGADICVKDPTLCTAEHACATTDGWTIKTDLSAACAADECTAAECCTEDADDDGNNPDNDDQDDGDDTKKMVCTCKDDAEDTCEEAAKAAEDEDACTEAGGDWAEEKKAEDDDEEASAAVASAVVALIALLL